MLDFMSAGLDVTLTPINNTLAKMMTAIGFERKL